MSSREPELDVVLRGVRHCTFNHLNCYKAPDWACLRIKGDHDIPIHFTVCILPFSGHDYAEVEPGRTR